MEQNSQKTNYIGPFITMVFLFFIIGFLTCINQQLQSPLKAAFLAGAGGLKNTFTTLIIFTWFLAYPLTGGIGSAWVNKFGYKGTLIRALLVMIFGMMIFFISSWFTDKFPSATVTIASAVVPIGFFIFLVGSYIVGAAVTILQVVVNPYLIACDVKGTQAVQRLQIGASSNSIGTTIGPYFVTAVIFGGLALEAVKVNQLMIPFIALIATLVIVTFVITKLTLPDIQGTKANEGEKLEKSIWSFSHLTLGVVAVFFYVGVEVAVGANINLYAGGLELFKNYAALMATLYWGGMLVGRVISSFMSNVSPKAQLIPTVIVAIILTSLAIAFRNPWFLVAIGLFHSVMWGAIFTLAVSKLGKYTSIASGAIMIGVLGGAVLPLIQGVLADALHNDWTWTWLIVIGGEAYLLYYALIGSKVKTAEVE
jgi:MFS transporter, FHS family, L-fucose permease